MCVQRNLRLRSQYFVQDMDREVLLLGRELAMCTLDVQLDFLFMTLEEELCQIVDAPPAATVVGAAPGQARSSDNQNSSESSSSNNNGNGNGAGSAAGTVKAKKAARRKRYIKTRRRSGQLAADLAPLAPRRGSTEELSVLLAQYAMLERRQAALQDVFSVCPHAFCFFLCS